MPNPRIKSVQSGSNASLISTIAPLYLDGHTIFDLTYGRGKWWGEYREPDLAFTGDYTSMEDVNSFVGNRSFDVVCYDPAYVSTSKSVFTSIGDMNNRYGLDVAPSGVGNVFVDMIAGFRQAEWYANKFVLQKCQQQVESGKLWDVPFELKRYILDNFNVILFDEIIHERGLGPQPLTNRDGSDRVWVRTHRSCSHLLVWKVL